MADYDSNLIKPVDSLQNISGLTPVKHREERNTRQQLQQESNEEEETKQGEETLPEKKVGDESDIDSNNIGIDYCA